MEYKETALGGGRMLSGFALGGEIEIACGAGDYFCTKIVLGKRVKLSKTKIYADLCLPLKNCKVIVQNNKVKKWEEKK